MALLRDGPADRAAQDRRAVGTNPAPEPDQARGRPSVAPTTVSVADILRFGGRHVDWGGGVTMLTIGNAKKQAICTAANWAADSPGRSNTSRRHARTVQENRPAWRVKVRLGARMPKAP